MGQGREPYIITSPLTSGCCVCVRGWMCVCARLCVCVTPFLIYMAVWEEKGTRECELSTWRVQECFCRIGGER